MAEEKKTTGKKPGRPKKDAAEKEQDFVQFADITQEAEAPAEDVAGVREDGTTVPLTEIAPELAGQTVTAPLPAEKEPEMPRDEKTYTADEVAEMVRRAAEDAVKKALASLPQQQSAAPNIIQYVGETERVQFLWQAEVADDNVVMFGDGGMYGQVVGKSGTFFVPKSELSRVLTDVNRVYLKRRWLIVVSGLTEEEREALDVDYKEGELLDKRAFAKMVELGDELLDIYPKLCEGHKRMVAQRYMEAYTNSSPYVTRERVEKLNEMSKADGGKGDFAAILEKMYKRDIQ
nr:MAG TPA: hypothetical protein [Caudoviricetes sp.]